ncbi:hypothetical protein GCM10020367_39090 [Streptomyces sannanensis]|uniref:Uncharacterized protein n=1 Tax=Streptomyces sannanensis TaxID=285536 RepID=A0ABP6SE73_9ACTN
MPTSTFAVAAAGVGAAVLATTGIVYAATAGSTQAAPSVQRAAPSVQRAAPPVRKAAPSDPKAAPAASDPKAAPAAAPLGSGSGKRDEGRGEEGRGRDEGGRGRDHERRDRGRIYFNEREYSAYGDGCITAASGLGSSSFNIFNDSKKTVEVFRGFTCDNGAPVAVVGPYGATNGVVTPTVHGGAFFDDGVVGSFRVIGGYGEFGGYDEW